MKEAEILSRLSDVCRRKHLSLATEKSYAAWVRSYSRAVRAMPRKWTSEQKTEAFLTRIARQNVAAATQNQALNAVAFLYREVIGKPLGTVDALRVRRPATIRTALEVDEVRRLLAAIEDTGGYPTRLVARLLYGCGLRLSEPLELRIKDVDLAGGWLVVRAAKGNKDRRVPMPEVVRGEMEAQLRVARAVAKADAASGLPVAMPSALERKLPRAPFQEAWAWVFPAHAPVAHPRTGQTVRWRMHEVNVQRAVRAGARKAGLTARVTPHVLRHSYATHVHRAGAAARDLEAVLGDRQLETTMRYLAWEPGRVRSPLD
jgi:integron integrase